jgi:hypothetical protein
MSLAIVVGAILIGSAAIASAIFFGVDRDRESTSTPLASGVAPDAPGCNAWVTARRELEAIPSLPAGWDWNTPDIDRLISDQHAAMNPVLDTFARTIDELPADNVTPLARRYIQAQRDNMQRQVSRTATAIDVDLVRSAYNVLNWACGLA